MIVITDPNFLPNEAGMINALFNEGLETLHLRKPEATENDVRALIEQIDSAWHHRLMIHNHYRLVSEYQLKGIHFTGFTKIFMENFCKMNFVKSMGIHSLNELDEVQECLDYVMLSPVFPSISKKGYSTKWDFSEMGKKLNQARMFKVVALGGITFNNVSQVQKLGFDDFAVLGNIWETFKPGHNIAETLEIFKKLQNEERKAILPVGSRV